MKKFPAIALALVLFLVIFFPIVDLTASALYSATGIEEVANIRYLRDLITIVLAGLTLLFALPDKTLVNSAAVYITFIITYAIVGLMRGLTLGLVFSSAAILLLPVLGIFAGVLAGHATKAIPTILLTLALMMSLSIIFGFYDINNTDFWSSVVDYGAYLRDIKGITSGFNPEADLPWNFFGNEGIRRAAGLLAAPLAQGSFIMSVGLCCFAWLLPTSSLLAIAVLSFASVGMYMSGTRGAMLVMLISLIAYMAMMGAQLKRYIPALVGAAILFLFFAKDRVFEIVKYSIQMSDGSTEGHLYALLLNLMQFHNIIITGDGVGFAGAIASYMGDKFVGGGEGAFFSIAFQLGLPGALVFLWYYFSLYRQLHIANRVLLLNGPQYASIARMLAAQAIGYVVTFFSSEHILTYSGMTAYWLMCGLILGASQDKLERIASLNKLIVIIAAMRRNSSTPRTNT